MGINRFRLYSVLAVLTIAPKQLTVSSFHMMTSWHGNVTRITGRLWGESRWTGGFLWETVSNADLSRFLWCLSGQAVEQRADLPAVWDALTNATVMLALFLTDNCHGITMYWGTIFAMEGCSLICWSGVHFENINYDSKDVMIPNHLSSSMYPNESAVSIERNDYSVNVIPIGLLLVYINSLSPYKSGCNDEILISWAVPVKLPTDDFHETSLMICQHWFR